MNDYMLLLHENPAGFADLSPQQMEEIVAQYSAWGQQLGAKGRMVAGHKLTDDGGRHVRAGAKGPKITDGPYAETKELIGGVFIIRAEDYSEAAEIAGTCPHANYGWVEVRQVDPVGG